jgi:peptide deformylase
MILPIEKGTENKILRGESAPVKKIDKKLCKFLDDMRETMYAADGVGLAAPQVGQNIRVVICRFNFSTPHETIVDMINPVITELSDELQDGEEGCLSIPGRFEPLARRKSLTVKFLDRKGRETVLKLKGMNARIVQHEVDHVNATLYVDRLGISQK